MSASRRSYARCCVLCCAFASAFQAPSSRFHALPSSTSHALPSSRLSKGPLHAPSSKSGALQASSSSANADAISDFCIGTNEFWSQFVVEPFKSIAEIRPKGTAGTGFFDVVTAAPETPQGIPRPVWLTILASAPSGLIWYGWYKYSVEEELFQYELATEGRVSGCGGFGTLLPFVFGVIIGGPLSLLRVPGGETLVEAAGAWILLGQLNLYRRVNEFYPDDEPLHAWWALLPPPLDVVVGLRQVHFLSEYWKKERGLPAGGDVVAEEWFPFIAAPRFTLKEFFRTPSMWFWFTKDMADFAYPILQDD
mmetsp:Transcript_21858/g.75401  ORF Transcript_21858/g.75401 Transcript_21858/m.75401 type:complete len:308 (+) Transcript_21858:24-947(+)